MSPLRSCQVTPKRSKQILKLPLILNLGSAEAFFPTPMQKKMKNVLQKLRSPYLSVRDKGEFVHFRQIVDKMRKKPTTLTGKKQRSVCQPPIRLSWHRR